MLKENWRFISRLEKICDLLIVVAAFILAYYGRSSFIYWDRLFGWGIPFGGYRLAPIKDYFIVLLVGVVGYGVTLNVLGAYGSMRLFTPFRILRLSFTSSFLMFLALASALFLLKIDLSRSFILLFCVLSALLLMTQRFVVLNVLRYWRRRGKNYRSVIIAGIGEQALKLGSEIAASPELGIRIIGFADLKGSTEQEVQHFKSRGRGHMPMRILSGKASVESELKNAAVDEVIFTDIVDVMPAVEDLVHICAEQGVRTTLAADLFSMGMVKSGISYFAGMPLIHYQTPPGDRWELSVKRFVDVFVSALLLILLSPLFAIIAVAIRITSQSEDGPQEKKVVLFKQKRVGLNGRTFSMYKFRSMRADAELMKKELLIKNEMTGPVFKLKNDPRVTTVGRFLRRFSLDELPQLWNVLRGDMSLVGPRPPVPGEVNQYERKFRRRLSMRPGMTCIWQVSGRNEIVDFESWVKLDLEYIDNWSLGRDFLLMMRTIPAVLLGTGAR